MKKSYITVALLALFTIALTSCREKTTGEKIENAVENAANDVEDAVN
jgi:predicted small secreted protein